MQTNFQSLKYWLKKAYRQGPRYHWHYQQCQINSRLDGSRLKAFQSEQLQKTIHQCVRSVPYYQTLFKTLGIRPEHIRTPEDLSILPLMDKHTVREQFDRLIARTWDRKFFRKALTSGSSGTPGVFLRDFDNINFENAAVWHYWNQQGDHQKRRITLRGELFCPVEQSEPPFWKYNPADQELVLSAYHLNPQNFSAYYQKIREFQPEVLYCYPSSGYLLARLFEESGLQYALDHIFTSSEMLEDSQRQTMEAVFGAPVHDWYGQAERVAALAQCREGHYHIQEHYSVVELLPSDNGSEVVGTTLFNRAMPLLRYRTHDTIEPVTTGCLCGSPFAYTSRIIGRPPAYLVMPDGRKAPNAQGMIMRGIQNVVEAQFIQDAPDRLQIRLVSNGRFSDEDAVQLQRHTHQYTGPSMHVDIQVVPAIPRGPNGKFQNLISHVDSVRELVGNRG